MGSFGVIECHSTVPIRRVLCARGAGCNSCLHLVVYAKSDFRPPGESLLHFRPAWQDLNAVITSSSHRRFGQRPQVSARMYHSPEAILRVSYTQFQPAIVRVKFVLNIRHAIFGGSKVRCSGRLFQYSSFQYGLALYRTWCKGVEQVQALVFRRPRNAHPFVWFL